MIKSVVEREKINLSKMQNGKKKNRLNISTLGIASKLTKLERKRHVRPCAV